MTKKLLMVSLLAVLFAAGTVLADEMDTVYVWYYDPAGPDTVWVSPGGTFDLNVFIMCSENAYTADLHLPLGINDLYFDDIPLGCCSRDFYPFHDPDNPYDTLLNWDDASFLADFEPSPPNPAGWHSRSFAGWADLGGSSNPWLYFTEPTQCLIFCVNAPIEDTMYLGETVCDAFQDGVSHTLGAPAAGDTLGVSSHTMVISYPCVYFSPNQAPSFVDLELYEPDECGECNANQIVVFDNDGDPIEISGFIDGEDPDITVDVAFELVATEGAPGEPTTYYYNLVYCGTEIKDGDLHITISDGVNDPVEGIVYDLAFLGTDGVLTASMEDLFILPGYSDWMPVYLEDCGCLCLGAFEFTIEYDPSVLSVLNVEPGGPIAGGEYWNVNQGAGWVSVVFIRDLNNQNDPRHMCEFGQPIFFIEFLLAPDEYPIDFCIPICFSDAEPNINYNDVADEGGYNVWWTGGCTDAPDSLEYGTLLLELECGNIKILCPENCMVGDLNLNGYPFEVGDVVVLANHLIDPVGHPLTLRQQWASDVNGDGHWATIADLMYMLRVLNEGPPGGGKLMPLDVIATFSMPLEVSDNLEVKVTSEASVGAALVSINHTGVELGVPVARGMDLKYSDNGDVMTVLIYSMKANAFAPGTNTLFTVPVLSEGTLSFGDVSASDNIGHLLDARSAFDALIPENFVVSQNFPNPFNAKTTISFGLPGEATVSIAIYNVAGQLVQTIDVGHCSAGYHSVVWDAKVASGIYFYKVTAGEYSETMKMTLLK